MLETEKNKSVPQAYRLRAHHVANLINGFKDDYQKLFDGLQSLTKHRQYAPGDAAIAQQFYSTIAANPENIVEVISGLDDRCALCSNYQETHCAVFFEKSLHFEDRRALKDLKITPGMRLTINQLLQK